MLPLELKIKGLYSYQEEQVIDFNALTQAGLFGIFGNVGSGKSSILEAIGFVLYSETERLNSRDGRAYNMLNLKSDEALIDFEFLNFEDRKFKFTARWTRNRKNFLDVGTIKRLAYEWIEDSWMPLESASAEIIVGLSYENFRRTIIIPQGQFKEFLELKGKDRSEMMKAIFNLQQFDLGGRVSYLQSENKYKQTELEGKLSGYELVSTEIILEKENELTALTIQLNKEKKELEAVESQIELLKNLKNKFEQLGFLDKRMKELNSEKPAIEALFTKIILFERTEKIFKSSLERLTELHRTVHNLKSEISNLEEHKSNLTIKIKGLSDEIAILQPKYDNLEQSKNKVNELDTIVNIMRLNGNIATLNESIGADEKNAALVEEEVKTFEIILKKYSSDLQLLKTQKMDASLLLAIDNWYSTFKNKNEIIAALTVEVDALTARLKVGNELFSSFNYAAENWKSEIEIVKNKAENSLKIVTEEEKNLLISNELVKYTTQLNNGAPCPLCGSEHHPNIMHIDDVSDKLTTCRDKIKSISEALTSINENETKLTTIAATIKLVETEKQQKQISITQKKSELEEHNKLFVWKDFHPEDDAAFVSKKTFNQKIEQEITILEAEIAKIQNQFEKKKVEKEELTTKISAVKSKIAESTGAFNNEKKKLITLDFGNFTARNIESIRDEINVLKVENQRCESTYKLKSTALIEKQQLLSTNEALISTKMIDFNAVSSQAADLEKSLEKQLMENNFTAIEEVQLIINQQIEVEKERSVIELFRVNFKSTAEQLSNIKLELVGKKFDPEIFNDQTKLFEEKKSIQIKLVGETKSKEDQLIAIKIQLKEKENLVVDYDLIKKRAHNLSILNGLFQANGFVNYVSTIYLQNLCDVANVRFHRMTKNQLSLSVNDKNEFDVIDYLNNGNMRSVKTLSGGQLFQASLCLALALAESVQTLSKGDKNFFFIDEGFGTQDQESIAIVFETLQTLYKENRIVGIISHVAEMKESIPRSITVEKDPERGSLIKTSWN